ncbi:hypothetical protein Nmel_017753 [Mimus melanotis]
MVCFPLKITSPRMFLSFPVSKYLLVALRLPGRTQSCAALGKNQLCRRSLGNGKLQLSELSDEA